MSGVAFEDDQSNVDLDLALALDRDLQLKTDYETKIYTGDFDERGRERVHIWHSFEWIKKEGEPVCYTIGGLRCVSLSPWRHRSRNSLEKFSFMVDPADGAYSPKDQHSSDSIGLGT